MTDSRRRRVWCWRCGHRARRVPGTRGLSPWLCDERGMVAVVGRRRRVLAYSACGAEAPWGEICQEPMLERRDARMVLLAAFEHERRAGNKRGEYDG